MFDSTQKSTGTSYTTVVALLIAAFVFSPAMLIMSRPFGSTAIFIAVVFSVVCAGAAWLHWAKFSNLTIPTILGGQKKP